MIPIVCSAVAVSACDASSAGLCVVQVFGGGRRAGVRKGGVVGRGSVSSRRGRGRRNKAGGGKRRRRRRSRCVWSRMRMRVGTPSLGHHANAPACLHSAQGVNLDSLKISQ